MFTAGGHRVGPRSSVTESTGVDDRVVALAAARKAAAASDFAGATRLFRRLLESFADDPRPDDTTTHLRALVGLAGSSFEATSDLDASLALLDRAEALFERGGPAQLRLPVLGQRALCLWRSGRVDQAAQVFADADPHLAAAGADDRVRFLLNRAALHLDLGALRTAQRDLETALEGGRRARSSLLEAKVLHNQGYLAHLRGDLPAALARMEVADQLEQGELSRNEPVVLLDRARVLIEAGLLDDADDLLQQVATVARADGRLQEVGESTLDRVRGLLIARRDLDVALELAGDAVAVFERRGNPRWRRFARYTLLAVRLELLQERLGLPVGRGALAPAPRDVSAALELCGDIEDLLRDVEQVDDPDAVPPLRFMLAEAAVLAGDRERAREALAGHVPGPDATVAVRLRWYRARAGLAFADPDEDMQEIVREGLNELASAQARVGSVDLRTAMAIHGLELAELGVIEALLRDDEVEVHRAIERAHASSTRLTPVRADLGPHDLDLLARLRHANEALWQLDTGADPITEQRLRAQVSELQQALRVSNWQQPGSRGRTRLVDLAELRSSLESTDAVAVSFTAATGRLFGLRLSPDGSDVVDLGPAGFIDEHIERLRSDLQAVVLPGVPAGIRRVMRRSILRLLAVLDDAVLAPLGVEGRRLVIVPHASLSLVPWSLMARRRRSATTVVPCLTAWVQGAAEARVAGRRPLVTAVAGPGLERAGDEATAVGRRWPRAQVVLGNDATRHRLSAALSEADLVHLATHGTHRMASPLFSSLRLADGPMFAHELGSDLAPRLVVLSACEVGSHTIRRGDEPLGLTAALLEAGVPTIVASLARLQDRLAHDVMVDVHDHLAGGASPADAVAAAVAAASDDGQLAPLTCTGAGLWPVG